MTADPRVYQSVRMAEAYAHSRPPMHSEICKRMIMQIAPDRRIRTALDAGCGAGASTAALAPYTERLFGVDPYEHMVHLAKARVESARFEQGSLESLPFESSFFQLVATAGAINYSNIPTALAEVHRVLEHGGWLAAYDFSAGRRLSEPSNLPDAYDEFRRKYPSQPGYSLDLNSLPYAEAGLKVIKHEEFSIGISMSRHTYVNYLLGDTGVEIAITSGTSESEVRYFCERLASPVFGAGSREVVFEAQLVISQKS
jgi:ubiquinone/menaquinone biosynthesis C-methylase UbiE